VVQAIFAALLKFLLFLGLPAIALWLVLTLLTAPLAAVMPGYFKVVLTPGWFVISFVTAMLGWNKRLSFWTYFIISLLFSPLVGIIVVVFTNKKTSE
jgi:hypothetical protein|tara:strand:+ start:196 stop:486 length:291 start_codon:yes stop_codon:yes gene_type:complete